MLRDNIIFIREFVSEFKYTGTICPSSRFAAEALASPVDGNRKTKNILEAGAGTGSVTMRILDQMVLGDRLTICEINPRLMKELRKKVMSHSNYEKHKKNIVFFEGPVQELSESEKFDALVCAIPFLNFEVGLVKDIFQKLLRISAEGAVMTYFEYIGLRKLGKVIPIKERKQRIKEVDSYMNNEYVPRTIGVKKVWLNVLPINVYTLNMDGIAA